MTRIPQPSDAAIERARRSATRIRNFYIHCLAFIVGNLVAFLINWMTLGDGDNPWWFQWGLLIWATALAIHGLTVLGSGRWLGAEWEERKVAQLLARYDRTPGAPGQGSNPAS
jgi:hypothetical protein